jgi:RNA polymerase sigma-70 factor (ECF subfamily)
MINSSDTAALYDRLSAPLFRYILRMAGDRQTAEDILHDTFISFIENSGRYDITGRDPAPLLFRIAKNKTIDRLRNSRKEIFHVYEAASSADAADETLIKDETNSALEHCVTLLDDKHKTAFNLRRDNELTFTELSKLSGIPERTLKRRVAEAVAQIADCLKKGGYITFFVILWHLIGLFP